MKTYMPLNGLRWSRNSGSANCDMPQSAVFGRPGGYFYEVYLVQGATLLVCREWITNDWLFVMLGLMGTIIMAKGMSMVNNWIVKRI
ncbi:hypothetical protein CIL02_01215 [Prevotella sp. P3-122]|nr:hypothetical protein CIL02_01215 [Prevotella sp. P3-122]